MKITRRQLRQLIKESINSDLSKYIYNTSDQKILNKHDPYKFGGQDDQPFTTLGVGGTNLGGLGSLGLITVSLKLESDMISFKDIITPEEEVEEESSEEESESIDFSALYQQSQEEEEMSDEIDYEALQQLSQEEESSEEELEDVISSFGGGVEEFSDLNVFGSSEDETDLENIDYSMTAQIDAIVLEDIYEKIASGNDEAAFETMLNYLDSDDFFINNRELVGALSLKYNNMSDFYLESPGLSIDGFPTVFEFDGEGDRHIERGDFVQFLVNGESAGVFDLGHMDLNEKKNYLYSNAIKHGLIYSNPFQHGFEQYFLSPIDVIEKTGRKLEMVLRSGMSYENYGEPTSGYKR